MSIFTYFRIKMSFKILLMWLYWGVFMGLIIYFNQILFPDFYKNTLDPIIEFLFYPSYALSMYYEPKDQLLKMLMMFYTIGILFWFYFSLIGYFFYLVNSKIDRKNSEFVKLQKQNEELKNNKNKG